MTKKEPLLSICIPTYNREKYLKRLLDSIVCQKEFTDTDDVEIVVDDGPSTDNTETMVKDYIKKYGNKIKYYRNPVRIGMCPAFLEALDYGTGKYLWLMGSDQVLMSKSLHVMLEGIEKESKTIIVGNPKSSMCINYYCFNSFSEFSSYIGLYPKDFLDIEGGFLTFCSFCCMSRKYYIERKKFLCEFDEEKLRNHYFNFNIIKYSGLYAYNSITYIDAILFKPSVDAESSWTINKKIVKDLLGLIKYIEDNYFVSKSAEKVFEKIKKIWIGAYMGLPFKRVCKLFHLENRYVKLGGLYRSFFK